MTLRSLDLIAFKQIPGHSGPPQEFRLPIRPQAKKAGPAKWAAKSSSETPNYKRYIEVANDIVGVGANGSMLS